MAVLIVLIVFLIMVVVSGAVYQMVYDCKHHVPLDRWSLVLLSVTLIFLIFAGSKPVMDYYGIQQTTQSQDAPCEVYIELPYDTDSLTKDTITYNAEIRYIHRNRR